MDLVAEMLAGREQALARLITLAERESSELPQIIKSVFPHLGKAYRIGITGPPGGGKSTIADKLTAVMRKKGFTIGIICADPSSPFTGGAVLGDRIRMQQHYLDEGVFIRSMACRDSQGGLPRTTQNVVKLLDAYGKDFVIVETVGVGQTELDIMENVDTIVVVLVPEAGDTIQTMKAGLFEIADIFVVNKADRPGAYNLLAELEAMLHLHAKQDWWSVPVLATQAVNNVGTEELYEEILKHRRAMEESGQLFERRRQQRRQEFLETIEQRITSRLVRLIERDGELSTYMEKVEGGELDPYSAAAEILRSQSLLDSWTRGLSNRPPE